MSYFNNFLYFQDIENGTTLEGGPSRAPKKSDKAFLARIWGNFDKKYISCNKTYPVHIELTLPFISSYMKPFLTHSRPTLLDTLPICCNPIARLLTTTEQMTQVNNCFSILTT